MPANRTSRYRNVLYLLPLYQELTVPPGSATPKIIWPAIAL